MCKGNKIKIQTFSSGLLKLKKTEEKCQRQNILFETLNYVMLCGKSLT